MSEKNNQQRPNILFLLADDQSWWSTGHNGHPLAVTPSLDALAAEGSVFDRHYITSPICMASRASIATGRYEYRTGCNFEHGRMSPEMFNLSYHCRLRSEGYFVGYTGKFGFGLDYDRESPRCDGYNDQSLLPGGEFDWWRGLPGQGFYHTRENEILSDLADDYPHLTGALAAAAGEFFDRAVSSEKPFCLTVGFKAPHGPLITDPTYDHVYRDALFPHPANYGEEGGRHISPQARTGRQWETFRLWENERFHEHYRLYFQLIHGLDCAVGRIRTMLAEKGLDENTVIIFSSDNGYFCGSHHMGGKVLTYEEASRVPLIIYDPRAEDRIPGVRIDQLTGNIDLSPTILDLAGADLPQGMDGVSLMPLLNDSEGSVRETLNLTNFWNMPPTQGLAVTDGTHKYIHYWYCGEGMQPSEELYDLKKDPYEMENLIGQEEEKDNSMRRIYDSAVDHIRTEAVRDHRYEHYGILFDRRIGWNEKVPVYRDFFNEWVISNDKGSSWRGGRWFEDLDLSNFPEEVRWCYGEKES